MRWLLVQPLPASGSESLRVLAQFGAPADALVLHEPHEMPLSLELAASPSAAAACLAVSTFLWEGRRGMAGEPEDRADMQDRGAISCEDGPLQS